MPEKDRIHKGPPRCMDDKDWYRFIELVRNYSFLAEHLIYLRTKGLDDDETAAYKTTKEYSDLRAVAMMDSDPVVYPNKMIYWDKPYRAAIETFWFKLQSKVGVSDSTIATLNKEYQKFLDDAREGGRNRREQRQKIKEKLNKIGG